MRNNVERERETDIYISKIVRPRYLYIRGKALRVLFGEFRDHLDVKKFTLVETTATSAEIFYYRRWGIGGSYRGFAGNTFEFWFWVSFSPRIFKKFFSVFSLFYSSSLRFDLEIVVFTGVRESRPRGSVDDDASSFIRLSIHRRESELSPWHGRSKTKSAQKERHIGSLGQARDGPFYGWREHSTCPQTIARGPWNGILNVRGTGLI